LTWNFFIVNGKNNDSLIEEDIKKISQEYNVDYILGGPFESLNFAVFSWKNKPYFVWYQDFQASIENKTTIRGYDFDFDSKIPLKSRLRISASFDRFENKSYDNYILVTEKKFDGLENFNLDKCYKVLCVYE